MLRFSIIFIFVACCLCSAQQIERTAFVSVELDIDTSKVSLWYSWVTDSEYIGVHNDTLTFLGISPTTGQELWGYDLPRRADGSYLFWKQNPLEVASNGLKKIMSLIHKAGV